jgi:hypothetical protein
MTVSSMGITKSDSVTRITTCDVMYAPEYFSNCAWRCLQIGEKRVEGGVFNGDSL